jgi:hypothetical protein
MQWWGVKALVPPVEAVAVLTILIFLCYLVFSFNVRLFDLSLETSIPKCHRRCHPQHQRHIPGRGC